MSVNSLNDIWQAVLGVLGQNLTDTAISTWFEDCEPVEIDGSTLVLKTSSDFKRDIIVKRFAETIKNAMSDIFSTEFTVKVLTEDELGDYEERKADNDPLPEMAGYTFDRFIVGNSNKFAHNAAVAVAHKPGSAYNPLFIYGNSGLGKTHLLLAIGQYIRENNPGAKIAYGLDAHGEDLRAIVESGRLEDALHWETVRPGDVYYIPNGTVHALGAGIQVYEIQQSSDATYRFWDWGRVGRDGRPRELHTEKALAVSLPDAHRPKIEGTTVLCKGGSRTYYISEKHFELCRLNLSGRMPLEGGRMRFLTALSPCTLRWGDDALELEAFDSVLVPAAMENAVLEGSAKVLMSSPSDRAKLRQELGYRAENVAGLTEE